RGGNASFPTSAIASTIRTPCLPELRAAVEHDPYRASGLVLGRLEELPIDVSEFLALGLSGYSHQRNEVAAVVPIPDFNV
ncbi:hypothetical protein, partial [Chitinimonas sp. BJB300]|uniref:hypothetical protein n=1 Tax=Chitinimonas sp. BJB300 TaxID=1559339 RepID=UPI001E458662